VALLPMSVLDHGSESILVPALLWWLAGTVLLDAWLRDGGWWRAAGATILLALCGLSRPDCLALALPTALLLLGFRHGIAAIRAAWPGLVVLAVAVVMLSVPGIRFLAERTAEDAAMGNLPHLGAVFFESLPRRLWNEWVIMDGRYFPRPLTWLAGLGVVAAALPGLRRRLFAPGSGGPQSRAVPCLALLSLAWAIPMLLDFNETSMLRLHAPSALLLTAAAAATLARLLEAQAPLRRLAAGWRIATLLLVAAGLAGGTAATVQPVFAEQNSVLDDRLLAEVAAHSRDGKPALYVTRSYDDPPDHGIHLLHPNYALEAGDRWLGVRHFERRRGQFAGQRVYWFAGLRCYAHRRGGEHDPGPRWRHTACATFCERHDCRPIWTREVANVGERGFAWFPNQDAVPVFEVGLYEVMAAR